MARWKIAYSRHNNTEVLEVDADQAPDIEQAAALLLEHARLHFDREGPGPDPDQERTAAVRLAEHYGVTVTGISRAE